MKLAYDGDLPKHVHTNRRRLAGGKVKIYRYLYRGGPRLYCEPGTLAFLAELDSHQLRTPPTPHPVTGEPRPTRIYFIRGATTGLIKIGQARRPKLRLRDLQCGSPDELALLGTIEDHGGGTLEAYLHAKFARHRSHGEWFAPVPELLQFITENARPLAKPIAA